MRTLLRPRERGEVWETVGLRLDGTEWEDVFVGEQTPSCLVARHEIPPFFICENTSLGFFRYAGASSAPLLVNLILSWAR